jgi:type II secretory pathway pseudopilin PulG
MNRPCSNRRFSPTGSRGFSIVETIVALGILVLGLFAVYNQFIKARQFARDGETALQARLLAHQEVERLRACPFDSLRDGLGGREAGQVPGHLRFTQQATLTTRPDGLIEIQVQVGWDVPPGATAFEEGKRAGAKGYKAP